MPNEPGSPQTHLDVRYDLILPDWHREIAEILHYGAGKYGDNSWKRLPIDDHVNHLLAHMDLYREGDTSERHLINMACRLMFTYWCDKQGQRPMSHDLPYIPSSTQPGEVHIVNTIPDFSKLDLNKLANNPNAGS